MQIDFSLAAPVEDGSHLGELYKPIRESGPVFWSEELQGWIVSGYAEVKALLKRHRIFTNDKSPQRAAFGPEAMLFHDTGLHNRIRAVWAKAVLPSAILDLRDMLRAVAARRQAPLLEALDQGEAVDLVPIFQDFTTDIITELMDVPDTRRDDFKYWNRIISGTAQLQLAPGDPRITERDAAKRDLYAFLRGEIQRHKSKDAAGSSNGNLTTMMIHAEGQEGITDEVVIDNLVNLFLGALDTTVRWLGNVVVQLMHHQAVLSEVIERPELLSQAAEEVQRYQSVVQVFTRHVSEEDFEVGNQTLRAGSLVYLFPGATGWDPAVFDKPEEFDIHRDQQADHAHLGFGFGLHQCLGMHLARAEIVAFLEPLLAHMPHWRIAEADYGASWTLWGPVQLKVQRA